MSLALAIRVSEVKIEGKIVLMATRHRCMSKGSCSFAQNWHDQYALFPIPLGEESVKTPFSWKLA